MGLISVGASLGVADRAAVRAPSVSPSAAAITASNGPGGATNAAAAAVSATAAASHQHHQRRHEFAHHHRANYSNVNQPHHDHPVAHSGSGRSKRGGRRKYGQNSTQINSANAANGAAAPLAAAVSMSVHQFPPPPIVTTSASVVITPAGLATTTTMTPSPATKATAARGNSSSATGASTSHRIAAPVVPPQVVRVVTFPTNVDPQKLLPFVLGAKGGARLQSYMAQSKCAMAHRPAASAGQVRGEQIVTLNRSGSGRTKEAARSSSEEEWRISFTLTAETGKRVDHGVRLLQSAIETAEQIILRRKQSTSTSSAPAVVSTQVDVDSGGNGNPSSGHASVSRAARPDHSIDNPPPPAQVGSSLSTSISTTSQEPNFVSASRDSVDERKAQTRIRYPPTSQPLKRGPGFAPSRSIAESAAALTTSTVPIRQNIAGKKRLLPSSKDDAEDVGETKKRERTSSYPQPSLQEEKSSATNMASTEAMTSSYTEENVDDLTDHDFDEFRIRLMRGIEFARQVDAEATRVKRHLQQEKQKYVKMIEQARTMQHQQRVADVVIRTQCAIMATNEPNDRKRRRIEQLSVVQDAIKTRLLLQNQKITMARCRRSSNQQTAHTHSSSFSELMKKVSAFRAAVSKTRGGSIAVKSVAASTANVGSQRENVGPATIKPTAINDEGVKATEVNDHDHGGTESRHEKTQGDSVPSSRRAAGVLRDMNLVQDYSKESDCALLHLLTGQRQYFYLEPISLSFGVGDLERLRYDGVRSDHDVQLLRQFILKRRKFGVDFVKSVQSVAANLPQALASSRATVWSTVQRPLFELHPLLLALHLLALHYHAVAILELENVSTTPSIGVLLADEDELSSDLFKFVLRPIRSSAIESSLNDALPISLVRETITHCPEVVNHVLDWKEDCDVPPELLQDVTALNTKTDKPSSVGSGQSTILSEKVKALQLHAGEFDRCFTELYRHFQGTRNGISGDKVVHLVNQLKALAAHLFVINTELQLHKWATVYVENGYSWFDEDMNDDFDSGVGMGCDRSYDKFTCLQDALCVWHNAKVVYSAKDEPAGPVPDKKEPVKPFDAEPTQPDSEGEPQFDDEPDEDPELVHLRQLTPPDVLEIVESRFVDSAMVAAYCLSSDDISQVRKGFNDSLTAMRASMKVLGRTAPWRMHVKHSNALKVEYTKQREFENKLLLHQWALYYKTRPLPRERDCSAILEESKTEISNEKSGQCDEEMEKCDEDNEVTHSIPEAEGGIVLEPGDTPEVVDMKLLRHEIENVAKQMHSMSDAGPDDPDKKKLFDACNLLAASCVSALTKFLGHDNDTTTASTEPSRSGTSTGRAGRQRANSTSRADSVKGRDARNHSPMRSTQKKAQTKERSSEETVSASIAGAGNGNFDSHEGSRDVEEQAPRSESRATGKKAKKGTTPTRRPRAHSTSSGSPHVQPAANISHSSVQPLLSRASNIAPPSSGTIAPVIAEPLRMGCSGCRDTRRRCTGCHGCCLHCVCLGCGCRMCCSSRTASVQKTLNLLVMAVETRMGCKWIELDSVRDQNERCGMVKSCSMCQQCSSHCVCHPSAQAAHRPCTSPQNSSGASSSATAGFPPAASRKERRFRINLTAAQRRQSQASGVSDDDKRGSSKSRATAAGGPIPTKRSRRSNSDATPSMGKDDSFDSTTVSDFLSSDQFSGSSTDGMPFASAFPGFAKNEQEDLFRAARVRMKLQRNNFAKPTPSYGMIPPNTLIDGEMLWHPDRIRLMWERKDVYGVLGVPREASSQLIKKQFRKLVLKLHPDKVVPLEAADTTSPDQAETWSMDNRVSAFVAVTEAYKLLSGEIGAIHGNGWKTAPTTAL